MTQLEILKERLERLYFRTPRIVTDLQQKHVNQQRLLTLADVGEDNPLWNTVLSYADEHARNELTSALAPNLSDSARQYCAGRAAAAEDFAMALRDLRINAEREANRRKQ